MKKPAEYRWSGTGETSDYVQADFLAEILCEIDLAGISLEIRCDEDTVLVQCTETYIVEIVGLGASSTYGYIVIL